jgi:hypothetical protein
MAGTQKEVIGGPGGRHSGMKMVGSGREVVLDMRTGPLRSKQVGCSIFDTHRGSFLPRLGHAFSRTKTVANTAHPANLNMHLDSRYLDHARASNNDTIELNTLQGYDTALQVDNIINTTLNLNQDDGATGHQRNEPNLNWAANLHPLIWSALFCILVVGAIAGVIAGAIARAVNRTSPVGRSR